MSNAHVPATGTGLPADQANRLDPDRDETEHLGHLPVRSIARVRDCRPGVGGEMIRAVSEVLDPLGASELAELRQDVQRARRDGEPLFRCEFCNEPVHVRVTGVARSGVTGGRRASFAHDPRQGRPPCPYGTYSWGSPEEIEARRYKGRQEGRRHRFLKGTLLEALWRDPACASAAAEEVVQHEGAWRKPDLLARIRGQRIGFDVQLMPPLIDSILGRQDFYSGAGMAHLWVVDAADLDRLERQGFQDVIWPQGGEVLGWDERTAELSKSTGVLTMMLLRIEEDAERRRIAVEGEIIGRDAILEFARRRVPIAQDAAARELWDALRAYDLECGQRSFDALAEEVGVPGWEAVRRDALIAALTTLAALVTGRRCDASRRDGVSAILNNFLQRDEALPRPNGLCRAWAPMIVRAGWNHPPVRRWIDREETRALLDAALADCAADPWRSQLLVRRWGPLLERLFPGLRLGATLPGAAGPLLRTIART